MKSCKNFLVVIILTLLFVQRASAQEVYFSQYHQTPMLTNPGMVAADDFFKADLHYRSQSIGAGAQAYTTPAFSLTYPLISRKSGRRWGGLGATVLQDNTGLGAIFKTTGGALAFAYNFALKPGNTISLGVQGGYYQRGIDESKLTTGNQHITGTDDLGENLANYSTTFMSAETGLFWNLADTATHTQRAFIGLSARQINQAEVKYTDLNINKLPMAFVATAGVRAFRSTNFEVMPNARMIKYGETSQINVGSAFRYLYGQSVDDDGRYSESSIGLNTWYSLGNAIIAGLEVHHKKLFVAFCYDFVLSDPQERSLSNSAMEMMIGYRKNLSRTVVPDTSAKEVASERPDLIPIEDTVTIVYEDPRDPTAKTNPNATISGDKPATKIDKPDDYDVVGDDKGKKGGDKTKKDKKKDKKGRKQQKKDQQDKSIQYEKSGVQLDRGEYANMSKAIIFPYNQSTLSAGTEAFLDKVVNTMRAHPNMKLEIAGHSCNEGSFDNNKALSENRAITVYNYLILRGINKHRLFVRGYADTKPVAPNDIEAGRIRNRRVELRVGYKNK